MTYLHYLAAGLVVLDVVTTIYCLQQDWAAEANGFLAKLIAKVGLVPAVALTHVAAVVLIFVLDPMPAWALVAIGALYGYAAENNIALALKHRK